MSPTIRVCHLGKYYPPAPGGIETHVRTLARAQAELGMEVTVLCVNHGGPSTIEEQDGPVAVTRFGRIASVAKLDLCPGVARALAKAEADILHMHVPNPTMILALLAGRPAVPVIVTYHSDLIRQKILGAIFRPIERTAWVYELPCLTIGRFADAHQCCRSADRVASHACGESLGRAPRIAGFDPDDGNRTRGATATTF